MSDQPTDRPTYGQWTDEQWTAAAREHLHCTALWDRDETAVATRHDVIAHLPKPAPAPRVLDDRDLPNHLELEAERIERDAPGSLLRRTPRSGGDEPW